MQRITKRKTMTERFRINLPLEEALNLITAFYVWRVQDRHGTFRFDGNIQQRLYEFARYLTQPYPKFGVMFCGTCGNGKTTMLYALQDTINELNARGHFSFLSKEFDVGMEIIDAKDIVVWAKEEPEKLGFKRRYSMLAIDDLGKEPTEVLDYGNVLSPVVDLLEFRYHNQLFTAVTTNLTPPEIRGKYGQRVADRFNEMLEVIRFDNISYRRLNRNGV